MQSNKRFSVSPTIVAALLMGGAVVGASGAAAIANDSPAPSSVVAPSVAAASPTGRAHSLADMVQAVGPSVVQIKVSKQLDPQQTAMPFGGEGSAMNEQLRRFFGFDPGEGRMGPQQRVPRAQDGLGSGFIIDRSGIVLTNNHVVEGASQVTVQLSDGREFKATVLGADPKTDVAVVRINGGSDFQAVKWGDSDHVRVGDSVFAVGSPFGLGNTVTAGIVSARSREIGAGPYDDFLQVDAAINSGNSGGPLFDGTGRVVGINTAIFSPSGGNVGIGFAIPARMAQRIADQIVANGSVSRGRIGVALRSVTPDIADAMGLKDHDGALIATVDSGGPASVSGLKQGDVVRSIAGKPIKDSRDLARVVADARPGTTVPITVLRQGRELALDLRIGNERNG